MLRKHGRWGAALFVAALLGGCVSLDRRDWTASDSGSGGMFRAAYGGGRSANQVAAAGPSDTVQRVRGVEAPREPLQVEPGNVWPQEEAPRATLANPDAALRGVPPWRPGEGRSGRDLPIDERPGGQLVPPRADAPPVDEQGPRAQRRRRGASSPPPPPIAQPAPSRLEVLPASPEATAPPPRRTDGRMVLTPGGPVTTTGGTERVQGYVGPGGGGGVIHRDGGVTTIAPSGGVPQSFPTPR